MTQFQLAEHINVSIETVRKREQDKYAPSGGTEKYYPERLKRVKACPEFYGAACLLSYQIRILTEIARRIGWKNQGQFESRGIIWQRGFLFGRNRVAI